WDRAGLRPPPRGRPRERAPVGAGTVPAGHGHRDPQRRGPALPALRDVSTGGLALGTGRCSTSVPATFFMSLVVQYCTRLLLWEPQDRNTHTHGGQNEGHLPGRPGNHAVRERRGGPHGPRSGRNPD